MAKATATKLEEPLPESDQLADFPHPRLVQNLVGHDQAFVEFVEAASAGKLHHAWLITGPKGIGKASFAWAAAKHLLGKAGGDDAVHRVEIGSHPNMLVIRKPWDEKGKKFKTVISVEEVRRTAGFFGSTAADLGPRICIVDAADDMNPNAANGLLKVLEEPPKNAIFFLIAHAPGRLLPTIKSRCRRLSLRPLDASAMEQVIRSASEGEALSDVDAMAQLGRGSPGRALALGLAGGLEIDLAIKALLRTFPKLDIKALHGLAGKVGARGKVDQFDLFADLYLTVLGDLALLLGGKPATGDENLADLASRFLRIGAGASPIFWLDQRIAASRVLDRAKAVNLDKRQVVIDLLLSLDAGLRGR